MEEKNSTENCRHFSLTELIHYQNNYSRLRFIQNNRKAIVPFVGAGISKECGLYLWNELLDELAKIYFTPEEMQAHRKLKNIEYADAIVNAAGNEHIVMRQIRELFENSILKDSISPYILTSCFSDLIITTNYDSILEHSSTYFAEEPPIPALLPFLEGQMEEAIQINGRNVLKLHGSIEEPASFIFSSAQYAKFYKPGSPLSNFLRSIFTGKKVLFVGCSLTQDKTLDILSSCVASNPRITHYAILPYPENAPAEEIVKRNRELSRMGIEPIFYPQGDYDAVGKLLFYVGETNPFLMSILSILDEYRVSTSIRDTISTIVTDSFYETAKIYPELLDASVGPLPLEYDQKLKQVLGRLKDSDTFYDILLDLFNGYIDLSALEEKPDIKRTFCELFCEYSLQQRVILAELGAPSLDSHVPNNSNDKAIRFFSDEILNNIATETLNALQYKPGMSFQSVKDTYELAKSLEMNFSDRIAPRTRVRLLNSIGAFSRSYNECDIGEAHIRKAISIINQNKTNDTQECLFLAKCHCNLAIVLMTQNKISDAIQELQKDLELKQKYGEKESLLSRSLDLYATLTKELDPFESGRAYIQVAQIKERLLQDASSPNSPKESTASLGTTIFNIALLARDLGLSKIAYDYVLWASQLRFSSVDKCNEDYCHTLNVRAELELLNHRMETATNIVSIISHKVALPNGYVHIMGHTFYVCALYYYINGNYKDARTYVMHSLNKLQQDARRDAMQIIKSKLLKAAIIEHLQTQGYTTKDKSSASLYQEVISFVLQSYGKDGIWTYELHNWICRLSSDPSIISSARTVLEELEPQFLSNIEQMKCDLSAYYNSYYNK